MNNTENEIIAIKNRIEELKNKRYKIQQIVIDFDKEIENLEKTFQEFNT